MRNASTLTISLFIALAGCTGETGTISESLVVCEGAAGCNDGESCQSIEHEGVSVCARGECGEVDCADGYACIEGICARERDAVREEPGSEEPGSEEPGGEVPGGEEPGGDAPRTGCDELAARCEDGGADACEVHARECGDAPAGGDGGDAPAGGDGGGDAPAGGDGGGDAPAGGDGGGDAPAGGDGGGDAPAGGDGGGDAPAGDAPATDGQCAEWAAGCEAGNAEACEVFAARCAG